MNWGFGPDAVKGQRAFEPKAPLQRPFSASRPRTRAKGQGRRWRKLRGNRLFSPPCCKTTRRRRRAGVSLTWAEGNLRARGLTLVSSLAQFLTKGTKEPSHSLSLSRKYIPACVYVCSHAHVYQIIITKWAPPAAQHSQKVESQNQVYARKVYTLWAGEQTLLHV